MCKIDFSSFSLQTERPAFIMGIVNATPDSFYEESRGGLERAFQLIDEGADILDIGGESTRPGFTEVDAEEEIRRIIPVIEGIRKKYSSDEIRISVDTRKASVFKAAYESGADILNDVSALYDDPQMQKTAFELDVPLVLMHRGAGKSCDVADFFKKRCSQVRDKASSFPIKECNIILDPGIGFGKTNEESIEIIKNTNLLCDEPYPLLMALSRKRCIGEMTGRNAPQRLYGTLAADLISVQKGAKIIRVHDVSAALDTLNVMNFLQ
ncbi:MAG: dihydropteroate synthase [Treponema sp.]|nr:dihydropteroate synthase [Treponema sp.]